MKPSIFSIISGTLPFPQLENIVFFFIESSPKVAFPHGLRNLSLALAGRAKLESSLAALQAAVLLAHEAVQARLAFRTWWEETGGFGLCFLVL